MIYFLMPIKKCAHAAVRAYTKGYKDYCSKGACRRKKENNDVLNFYNRCPYYPKN